MPRAASRQAVALTLRGAVALLDEALAVLRALPDADALTGRVTLTDAARRIEALAKQMEGRPPRLRPQRAAPEAPRQVTNYLDDAGRVVAGAPDFAGDEHADNR